MDLRQWTENAVKGESKKKVRLNTEQIEKAADIYHTWQCEGIDGTNYAQLHLAYRRRGVFYKGVTYTPIWRGPVCSRLRRRRVTGE